MFYPFSFYSFLLCQKTDMAALDWRRKVGGRFRTLYKYCKEYTHTSRMIHNWTIRIYAPTALWEKKKDFLYLWIFLIAIKTPILKVRDEISHPWSFSLVSSASKKFEVNNSFYHLRPKDKKVCCFKTAQMKAHLLVGRARSMCAVAEQTTRTLPRLIDVCF